MKERIGVKRLHASKNEKSCMVVPQWLNVMHNTIFFNACIAHPDAKRSNLDHFCIDCLQPICSNCLPQHMFHKYVKIRRYVYSDVINRQDLCKLFNCSGIQTYHTNKAKVVFLKQRHQQQQQQQQQQNNSRELFKCIICHRCFQANSLYCSVACKVLAVRGNECQRKIMSGAGHNFEDSKEKLNGGPKGFRDGKQAYLAIELPFTKSQRPKLKRKGVPLRAPMF